MLVFLSGRCSKSVVPEERLYKKAYMGSTLYVFCRKSMEQIITSCEKEGLFAEEVLAENRAKFQKVSDWYV